MEISPYHIRRHIKAGVPHTGTKTTEIKNMNAISAWSIIAIVMIAPTFGKGMSVFFVFQSFHQYVQRFHWEFYDHASYLNSLCFEVKPVCYRHIAFLRLPECIISLIKCVTKTPRQSLRDKHEIVWLTECTHIPENLYNRFSHVN